MSEILFQVIINVKLLTKYFKFFFSYKAFKIRSALCAYSTSQFAVATFQVLNSHILDSADP